MNKERIKDSNYECVRYCINFNVRNEVYYFLFVDIGRFIFEMGVVDFVL